MLTLLKSIALNTCLRFSFCLLFLSLAEVGVALATGAAPWSFLRPRDVSIHGAYFSTCKLSAEWLRITAAETLSTSLLLQLLVMAALLAAPPMFSICSAAASSPSPALDCLELLLALPIAFLTEYPIGVVPPSLVRLQPYG